MQMCGSSVVRYGSVISTITDLDSARERTNSFQHWPNEVRVEFIIRVDIERSILARTSDIFVPEVLLDSFSDACEWTRLITMPHNDLAAV